MAGVFERKTAGEDIDFIIQRALDEDSQGVGDLTSMSTVPADKKASARFLAKADGVVAGLDVAVRVFGKVDPSIEVQFDVKDGAKVTNGQYFGSVSGPVRGILTGERIALNLMQRMSGVATQTRAMVDACKPHRATILDTRKTAPGLRTLDKLAVKLGGGVNHRFGLYDMVMIKDNHVDAAGGIKEAVEATVKYLAENNHEVPVEVETRSMDEVRQVLALNKEQKRVDRVMLDNFVTKDADGTINTERLKEAMAVIEADGVPIETEASGNVTIETVNAIAATNVEFISSGSLTHSVTALDISLKINK